MPAIQITVPAELVDLFSPAFAWWKAETGNTTLTIDQWANQQLAGAALPVLLDYQRALIADIIAAI